MSELISVETDHKQDSLRQDLQGVGETDAMALNLSNLPAEVLGNILKALPPEDVMIACTTCSQMRKAVTDFQVWRAKCWTDYPILKQFAPTLASEAVEGDEKLERDSNLFRALYKRLRVRPIQEVSLAAEAMEASSTDNIHESVQNVLHPGSRMVEQTACYWSSGPSDDAESREFITLQLLHPVCLVHEIQIRPFKAYFQMGHPIYSSKRVRFHLTRRNLFHFPSGAPMYRDELMDGDLGAASFSATTGPSPAAAGEEPEDGAAEWGWSSEEFPMAQVDELQRFAIPPTLCFGGEIKIELIGRVQRQDADHRFYTCLCYVRVVGTPVVNFTVVGLPAPRARRPDGHAQPQLCYEQQDPLFAGGGNSFVEILEHVSLHSPGSRGIALSVTSRWQAWHARVRGIVAGLLRGS